MTKLNVLKNYGYVHIPKTGGTTVEYLFFNKYCQSNHNGINSYTEHFDKYLFTFVRNPYTRIISSYLYYKNGGNETKSDALKMENINSLADFLKKKNKHLKKAAHLRTQYSYLQDNPSIDFIGRFENFENDLNFLCKKLKIKNSKVHLRKGKKNTFTFIITPEEIDLISDLYHVDFTKYNYKKIKITKEMSYSQFLNTFF